MYVSDGKHIRKVKMRYNNMNYKYASVRIGLFKRITKWGYYSDPVKSLLSELEPLGWKQIDIKFPFIYFLKNIWRVM